MLFTLSNIAQGLFENVTSESNQENNNDKSVNFGGFVRASAYGGSENYDYSNVFGEFSLQTRMSANKTFFYGDIRVREGLFFNERQTIFELKEAYAAYVDEYVSVSLGNQIVKWGRTDGFNPTNNITPTDYFFLTPDPDDQLMSNFMLRSKVRISSFAELDFIALPLFKESNYRYELFNISEEAKFYEAVLPERSFDNASFGARLDFVLPSIEFAFSYFYGYDPFYGFRVNDVQLFPAVNIYYIPDFYKKSTIGADFAIPLKQSIVRGEIAYNHTKDYKSNMHIPMPDISNVFGIEHNFLKTIFILQYIGQYNIDFYNLQEPVPPNPDDIPGQIQYAHDMINYESELFNRRIFNQQQEFNHAVMISLNRSFAYELLNFEFSGYYNFTSEEVFARPKINWKITDNLAASFGASLMFGPDNSVFYYSSKVLNGAFLSLKAGF